MSRLSDVANLAIRTLLGNRVLNRAVLAIDGTAAQHVQTTNAIEYSVDGVIYNKAALNDQSIAVTHRWNGEAGSGYVQPANTTVYYTLGLNSAGTLCCVQGSYSGQKLSQDPTVGVGQSVAGATWVGDGSIPDVPSGYTAFGVVKVASGGATFTAGTTALTTIGSFFDLAGGLPAAASL